MTTIAAQPSWPIAMHPDAFPIARSPYAVDVVCGDHVARIVSDVAGVPAAIDRLLRERPLGAYLATNRSAGFSDEASGDLLRQLGREGFLRRIVAPDLAPELLLEFEHALGALARHETAEVSRFDFFGRVRAAHVAVVGVGLTGAHVVQYLASSGVGALSLVDPACVSGSQVGGHPWFTPRDVGRPKVSVIEARSRDTHAHTAVSSFSSRIGSELELAAWLSGLGPVDALVYAVDRADLGLGTWAVHCARQHGFAVLRVNRVVVGPLYRPNASDACPACVVPRLRRGVTDLDVVFGLRAQDRDETAFLWPGELATFGALAAHELVTLVSGAGTPMTINRQMAPRLDGLASEPRPFPREPSCGACGEVP